MWGLGETGLGGVQWWDLLVETVAKRYNQWLLASPFLERLHLNPPEEQEYKGGIAWISEHQCSIPKTFREELIPARVGTHTLPDHEELSTCWSGREV